MNQMQSHAMYNQPTKESIATHTTYIHFDLGTPPQGYIRLEYRRNVHKLLGVQCRVKEKSITSQQHSITFKLKQHRAFSLAQHARALTDTHTHTLSALIYFNNRPATMIINNHPLICQAARIGTPATAPPCSHLHSVKFPLNPIVILLYIPSADTARATNF